MLRSKNTAVFARAFPQKYQPSASESSKGTAGREPVDIPSSSSSSSSSLSPCNRSNKPSNELLVVCSMLLVAFSISSTKLLLSLPSKSSSPPSSTARPSPSPSPPTSTSPLMSSSSSFSSKFSSSSSSLNSYYTFKYFII